MLLASLLALVSLCVSLLLALLLNGTFSEFVSLPSGGGLLKKLSRSVTSGVGGSSSSLSSGWIS